MVRLDPAFVSQLLEYLIERPYREVAGACQVLSHALAESQKPLEGDKAQPAQEGEA